jgi:2-dehydro-3-deoxygluconokinase
VAQSDVVVFGEAMAMFIADAYSPLEPADHYTRDFAGAELNVAVGLARLGYRVGWMSRLGTDPFGRYIVRRVRQAGVDTSRAVFDAQYPTSFQLKSRVRHRDPEVVYYRHGSAASHMAPNPEDDAYVRTAQHLHVTGILPALAESACAYARHTIAHARSRQEHLLRPEPAPEPVAQHGGDAPRAQ